MSRTYRNHYSFTRFSNKESMLKHKWISKWTGEVLSVYDEDYWNKSSRDKSRDGNSKKNYREMTNDIIRNKTRNDLFRVKNDPELYENMTFATKHDAKYLAWCIW